jgi:hypothetical protein
MRELSLQEQVKFPFDVGASSYQLDLMLTGQVGERVESARNGGPRGVIAPHGIHGDARQAYASCAATRCSPA